MNNRGFTLAELLITLGVVGVISALLGTALVNMQPDQDKIRYLKRFDSIKTSVNDLARNSRLFPVCQDNLSCKDHPLFNTAAGVSGRYTAIGDGDEKFCVGLSMMLNGRNLPNLNCTNQPIEYKDGADWTPSFETQNGTQWLVSTLRTLSGTSAVYQSDIYFDINGADGPNCLYDSESCPVPDRFKVMVAANGTVIAADPVGQYYLTTRKNFKKRDLEIEENASVTENLNANLRSFTLTPCALEVASADSPVTPPAGGGNGSAVNPGGGTPEAGADWGPDTTDGTEIKCGDVYKGRKVNCVNITDSVVDSATGYTWRKERRYAQLQYPANSTIILSDSDGAPGSQRGMVTSDGGVIGIWMSGGFNITGDARIEALKEAFPEGFYVDEGYTETCTINIGESSCSSYAYAHSSPTTVYSNGLMNILYGIDNKYIYINPEAERCSYSRYNDYPQGPFPEGFKLDSTACSVLNTL